MKEEAEPLDCQVLPCVLELPSFTETVWCMVGLLAIWRTESASTIPSVSFVGKSGESQ